MANIGNSPYDPLDPAPYGPQSGAPLTWGQAFLLALPFLLLLAIALVWGRL